MGVRKAHEGTWSITMWEKLEVPMEWLEIGSQVSMVRWRKEWIVARKEEWSTERIECKERKR